MTRRGARADTDQDTDILIDAPSANSDSRGGVSVDMLVLHYTGMANGAAALKRLTDSAPTAGAYAGVVPGPPPSDPTASLPRVSAHYLVEEDGRVFRLVMDEERAWHAGVGAWAGQSDINARSIGIEIVNGGHDYGLPAYTAKQIDALAVLARVIVDRHGIPPWRVVGHACVAPERKRDPGERFPWELLASYAGVGLSLPKPPMSLPTEPALHPGAEGPVVAEVQAMLAGWGYEIEVDGRYGPQMAAVVRAFKARWGRTSGAIAAPDQVDPRDIWTLKVMFGAARHAADAATAKGTPYRSLSPEPAALPAL